MDAFGQLKKADPAANGYTPPQAPKKGSASSPFINIEKTVICAKCGGQLLLDKEKGLFECKFCGVAYGTSLFFNNPLEKANKALNKADYIEADQRYSHMLMIDPSDFDALLGWVFCVGKWKSIEDIRLSETMIPVVASKLRERIGEAVKHCQDEDRKFFKTLEQFAEVIISYAETEQEIKKCSKESELVKYKTEIHIVGDKTQKELAGKTSELENRINTCKTTKQNLYERFGEIREELFTESTHHENRMAVLKARGG